MQCSNASLPNLQPLVEGIIPTEVIAGSVAKPQITADSQIRKRIELAKETWAGGVPAQRAPLSNAAAILTSNECDLLQMLANQLGHFEHINSCLATENCL
jgi:hypothetical protein